MASFTQGVSALEDGWIDTDTGATDPPQISRAAPSAVTGMPTF
ncbi:MAG TPA: hypothetical protein VFH30_13975 [Acidimicrobiales bacterium]|nr:hypothetical protein [Acidimicrobiales bacterium]